MQNTKPKTEQDKTLISKILITILAAATFTTGPIGCAGSLTREKGINTILEREMVLISSIKKERSNIEITNEIEKSQSLKKAELHLTLSLDEILNANEIIMENLYYREQKELRSERGQ